MRVVTAGGAEIGFADLVAQAIMSRSAKTVVEELSERIKRGKRAVRPSFPCHALAKLGFSV